MAPQSQDRERRLANALRENLKRRKAHARAAQSEVPATQAEAQPDIDPRPNKDKNNA